MPSLKSLVDAHASALLVDSASSHVHVGLLRTRSDAVWWRAPRDAGAGVFAGVEALLTLTSMELGDIGTFVFCEGPGSNLGIRTAAMALRAWQAIAARPAPAFGYFSLELVARDLCDGTRGSPFAVVADARRNAWHLIEVSPPNRVSTPRRVSGAELARYAGEVFTPDGFGIWSATPRPIRPAPYDPPALWTRHATVDLMRPAPEPEAFQHEAASYALWTPRIHRAPMSTTP